MKLTRAVLSDTKRALCSAGFVCCVLAVFVMCFTNKIGVDPRTMDALTIPAVLSRPELIKQDVHYCAFQVFTAGSPLWVTMFTPVLAAFAYVPLLCDERRSGFGRMLIARLGKTGYAAGHAISAMLTGGITMLAGFLLFGIAVYLLFPSLQSYGAEQASAFLAEQAYRYLPAVSGQMSAGSFAPVLLMKFAEMFLFGAFSALPALFCTAFTQNKYTVLCLPFFAAYVWSQLHARLSAKFARSASEHMTFLRFLDISRTDAMLSAAERHTLQILLLHGGTALLLILGFCILMQRRRDCGA